MHDPFKILKADHREVEKLLKELVELDEGDERDTLAEDLEIKLTSHMEIEENLVYPLLADYVGTDDEDEASIEHGLIRQGLATVMAMRHEPGFGAAVEMVAGGIAHHVHEEEDELLPELKDAMPHDDWMMLGESILKAKEAAGIALAPPTTRRSLRRSVLA